MKRDPELLINKLKQFISQDKKILIIFEDITANYARDIIEELKDFKEKIYEKDTSQSVNTDVLEEEIAKGKVIFMIEGMDMIELGSQDLLRISFDQIYFIISMIKDGRQ